MSAAALPSRETLLLRAAAREELIRRQIDRDCKEWIISHKRGPMYWLRNFTRTENYQWREQGLRPEAPFPYKPHLKAKIDLKSLPFPHDLTRDDPPDYMDVVMGYLLSTKELWVPKTREMMTSWLVVGFITWFCQFYEKIQWIGQSEDDDKAMGLIKYANILYSNQPDWMKERHPLARGEEGTLHKVEWAHAAGFQSVASGQRKLASKHPHGYFNDESGHQPGWSQTLDIAKPAVKQIVCVSSVAPGDFWNEVNAAI